MEDSWVYSRVLGSSLDFEMLDQLGLTGLGEFKNWNDNHVKYRYRGEFFSQCDRQMTILEEVQHHLDSINRIYDGLKIAGVQEVVVHVKLSLSNASVEFPVALLNSLCLIKANLALDIVEG